MAKTTITEPVSAIVDTSLLHADPDLRHDPAVMAEIAAGLDEIFGDGADVAVDSDGQSKPVAENGAAARDGDLIASIGAESTLAVPGRDVGVASRHRDSRLRDERIVPPSAAVVSEAP